MRTVKNICEPHNYKFRVSKNRQPQVNPFQDIFLILSSLGWPEGLCPCGQDIIRTIFWRFSPLSCKWISAWLHKYLLKSNKIYLHRALLTCKHLSVRYIPERKENRSIYATNSRNVNSAKQNFKNAFNCKMTKL